MARPRNDAILRKAVPEGIEGAIAYRFAIACDPCPDSGNEFARIFYYVADRLLYPFERARYVSEHRGRRFELSPETRASN